MNPTYYQQNGAYFTLNNGLPAAVTDPNILSGLRSGSIQSQQGTLGQNQGGGDVIGNILGGVNVQSSIPDDIRRRLEQDMNVSTDPAFYRQNYINMFQDRINSLNQIYDQQLAKAQLEGKGRVGQGTAILARRGIAGSPRAGGIQEGILEQNRGIEATIQAERAAQLGAVMGQATALGLEEAAQKRAAKEESTTKYLEYLKTEEERAGTRAGQIATQLLERGIDLDNLSQSDITRLVKEGKINALQLKTAYSEAKAAQAEAEFEKEGELLKRDKTKAEISKIDADIEFANKKFEEDKRQFGLEYALKERAQSLDELKAAMEAEKDKATEGPSPYAQERALRTVQSVDALLTKANATPGIFGRTAAVPWPDALRSDSFRNFESELNTLKSNIAFGELTAMREASKTGGALGNVSDREANLLQSALGALDMKQSPENFKLQLMKVKDSINRWQREVSKVSELSKEDEDLLKEYGL